MQLNEMSRIAGRQRYSSPVMQERRRRILAEARALLAEAGEPGFNIRELSRRAGVSSRTLYHAFGGRDGILGHAIAEHIERSEEHTSELQSLMRISYAVFCLKKKTKKTKHK